MKEFLNEMLIMVMELMGYEGLGINGISLDIFGNGFTAGILVGAFIVAVLGLISELLEKKKVEVIITKN